MPRKPPGDQPRGHRNAAIHRWHGTACGHARSSSCAPGYELDPDSERQPARHHRSLRPDGVPTMSDPSASAELLRDRLARNEAVYRDVNEQIDALNSLGPALPRFPIVCECASEGCAQTLTIEHELYEAVRAHPERFIVKSGHVSPMVDEVVEDLGELVVVAKRAGKPRQVAEATDPRTNVTEAPRAIEAKDVDTEAAQPAGRERSTVPRGQREDRGIHPSPRDRCPVRPLRVRVRTPRVPRDDPNHVRRVRTRSTEPSVIPLQPGSRDHRSWSWSGAGVDEQVRDHGEAGGGRRGSGSP